MGWFVMGDLDESVVFLGLLFLFVRQFSLRNRGRRWYAASGVAAFLYHAFGVDVLRLLRGIVAAYLLGFDATTVKCKLGSNASIIVIIVPPSLITDPSGGSHDIKPL
jgi:hypothetical protein